MAKKRLILEISTPYAAGLQTLIDSGLYESEVEVVLDALRKLFNHYDISCISDCITVPQETSAIIATILEAPASSN
jgi:hypothetical protein